MAHRMSAALAAVLLAGLPAGMALAQTSPDSGAAPATQTDTAPAAPAPAATTTPADAASPAGQSTPSTAPAADTTGTTGASDGTGPAPTDGATDGTAPSTSEPAAQAAESGDGSTGTPAPDAVGNGAAETTPPAPADPGQPADATPPATAQTDAAPAGEPRPGTYYTESTHGDWTLRCMKAAEGQDPCELYQLMKDDQGSAVAEVSVIPFTGEAAAILNFVAPLETDLGAGLGLQVDGGQAAKYPFMVCAPIGCISRIGMTSDELATFKRGNAATVTLLPFGGNPDQNTVRLSLSLTGFTAGFDALAAQPAPAPAQ